MTKLFLMEDKDGKNVYVREEHVQFLKEKCFELLKEESVGELYELEMNTDRYSYFYTD